MESRCKGMRSGGFLELISLYARCEGVRGGETSIYKPYWYFSSQLWRSYGSPGSSDPPSSEFMPVVPLHLSLLLH